MNYIIFNIERKKIMGKYDKNYVQTLQEPANAWTPEFGEIYKKFSKRILWIDGNVVPGSFQMNTAWYYAVPELDPIFEEHSHPYDEIIGFYGTDFDHPYDLDAEIEVAIGGEKKLITQTTLMFVPANVPHMPMRILRVGKPVFHFSVVTNPEYSGAYK